MVRWIQPLSNLAPATQPSFSSSTTKKPQVPKGMRRRSASSSQIQQQNVEIIDVVCEDPEPPSSDLAEKYVVKEAVGMMVCGVSNQYTLKWFSFTEHLYFYFSFMMLIFILFFAVVLGVDIFYKSGKDDGTVPRPLLAFYVFLPHILMFLGPVVLATVTRDLDLLQLLVLNDRIEVLHPDRSAFSKGFDSQVMSVRKKSLIWAGCSAIVKLVSYLVTPPNISFISYYVSDFLLWSYLVVVYMLCITVVCMAVRCFKLHINVYKNSLAPPLRHTSVLSAHYTRLGTSIQVLSTRLSHFIFWQGIICTLTVTTTLAMLYHTYFKAHPKIASQGAVHFFCLSFTIAPSFWYTLLEMEDLNTEFQSIGEILDKQAQSQEANKSEETDVKIKSWRRLAKFMMRSSGGVYVFNRKVDKSVFDLIYSSHLSLILLIVSLGVPAVIELLGR